MAGRTRGWFLATSIVALATVVTACPPATDGGTGPSTTTTMQPPTSTTSTTVTTSSTSTTTSTPAATTVLAVAAGRNHTCALLSTRRVRCWGANSKLQLGNGSTASMSPLQVVGLTNVVSISAGGDETCAVVVGGAVQCWGSGRALAQVSGLTGAIAVATSGQHRCAVIASPGSTTGTVDCWGKGNYGQLGTGYTVDSTTPLEVAGISSAAGVSLGESYSCATIREGAVWQTAQCWGLNQSYQLGNGTNHFSELIPTPVATVSLSFLSAGYDHACGISETKTARCWANNFYGQLGTSNSGSGIFTNPVTVVNLDQVVSISAGLTFTCAARMAGNVYCWGNNGAGQLGNGMLGDSRTPATAVFGLSSATQVVSGDAHSCALLSDSSVRCWGYGPSGELGGTPSQTGIPVSVVGITT